jgi:LacI family transcriptional regulator, repressor for deo operon, udp, cdd, tsx, nupC, and nupG
VALGAIRTLLDRGYRVPEDVAVVGIDDIQDGRFSTPSLTTIAPDKAQIANLVVELLLSRVKQGNTKPPRRCRPTTRS